jgi:penicillin V acylase-like amidase (Ntn superfamily)
MELELSPSPFKDNGCHPFPFPTSDFQGVCHVPKFPSAPSFVVGCCLVTITTAIVAIPGASAYTRVLWSGKGDTPVLVGRNMDWFEDMRSNLWILPRGVERDGLAARNSLKWTSKYGSVVVSSYEAGAGDGVNEKRLSGNLLYLVESKYGVRDENRPGLCVALWLEFCLDNFASVEEAVAYFTSHDIQILPATAGDPAKKAISLHLTLGDASGDSAVIEFVAGKAKIYHGRESRVMTRSPTYDKQLQGIKNYQGFGGSEPLPGTTAAADQLVRAAYYACALPEPKSPREAIGGVLSVMRNVAQPFGVADPQRPNISSTIWRTVADLTHGVYYFESSLSPNIIWVHFDTLDFSEKAGVRKLDLIKNHDLVGDVTLGFRPAHVFEPLRPDSGY